MRKIKTSRPAARKQSLTRDGRPGDVVRGLGLPAGLVALLLPSICAGQARPYAGLLGGVSTLSADGQSTIAPPVTAMSSYKPGNGPTFDAFAGVHWNNFLSFQADYLWNRNPLTLDVLRVNAAGSMFYEERFRGNQQVALGNVLLYFRTRSSWVRPYLSVGTGVVHLATSPYASEASQGIIPPGAFHSNMAALHVAVGIDLRIRRGWAFRYSFAETLSPNPISRHLAPPGGRMLANFRNLFGIAKEF